MAKFSRTGKPIGPCDLEIGDELIAVLSLQHDASNGTAGWQQLADEVVDEAVGERDGRGGMCAGDVRKSGSTLCVQQRVENLAHDCSLPDSPG